MKGPSEGIFTTIKFSKLHNINKWKPHPLAVKQQLQFLVFMISFYK